MSLNYRIVETREGYVGIVGGERGLRRVFLPQRNVRALRRAIQSEFEEVKEDPRLLGELADGLRRYFQGEPVDFAVRLDFGESGAFMGSVWRACRKIGYGRTRSYKVLARNVGRPAGARAVGMAMSRNPFPIVVPCHRVVKSDGGLGGYSGPGGVRFKRRLLEMEQSARLATRG